MRDVLGAPVGYAVIRSDGVAIRNGAHARTNADEAMHGRGERPRVVCGKPQLPGHLWPELAIGKRNGNRMNMKRMRGRNHRNGGVGGGGGGGGGGIRHHGGNIPMNRNHVFDSNGPDMRVRGTSQQLFEKYLQLGRDATSSGDRVMAESYFQHAEHYFRILNAMNQAAQQNGQAHQQANPPRRQYNGTEETGQLGDMDNEDADGAVPGTGDQPEARDIPISAAPPDA